MGNYFGAIKEWIKITESTSNFKCIYSICDLHSLTSLKSLSSTELNSNIKLLLASLLACGLNYKKCILFLQSSIEYHTSFAWILACLTTTNKLAAFNTYKSQIESLKPHQIPVGLFIYPVLQASDILLYKTNYVPVGRDQLQHIQLAQKLTEIFNKKYSVDLFPSPKGILSENHYANSIKSLRDPEKKMSKSDDNPKATIFINDKPEDIEMKIMRAKTDFTSQITFQPELRPGISNLVILYSLFTGLTVDQVVSQSQELNTEKFKKYLSEIIIESLKPIQSEMNKLLNENQFLLQVIQQGNEQANEISSQTINQVYDIVGLKLK